MKGNKKGNFTSYLFLAPAMAIYLSVIIIPVLYSLYISLNSWNGIGVMKFIGFDNYINLFTADNIFKIALRNNLIWIVLTLVVTTSMALLLANALSGKFRGRTFFRGAFYLPCVIAPIAVAIIWRWMYNPNVGFINQSAQLVGSDFSQTWLSTPGASLFAIFLASLWAGLGQPMILFLAGIQGISVDVLEAAQIDGAGSIRRFFSITIPLLKETFVIVIATLMVAALKVFDIVKGLTDGGPQNSTEMLATYMYSQTFKYNNVGMGTAIACVMLIFMMMIVIPYIIFTAKED
jgi:ABC-type sugar transport systems, permease components